MPAVQRQHVEVLLDQRDERQEGVPPGLPGEQVRGPRVARRHHDDAALEQGLEHPAQDHRVGDVVDLELVEAEQRGLRRDLVRERRDRVVAVRVLPLPGMDAGVRLLHEAVKMDAPLARDLRRLEEQVHQHGLAAANLADEVEAVRPPLRDVVEAALAAEQPGEQARRLGRGRIVAAQRRP